MADKRPSGRPASGAQARNFYLTPARPRRLISSCSSGTLQVKSETKANKSATFIGRQRHIDKSLALLKWESNELEPFPPARQTNHSPAYLASAGATCRPAASASTEIHRSGATIVAKQSPERPAWLDVVEVATDGRTDAHCEIGSRLERPARMQMLMRTRRCRRITPVGSDGHTDARGLLTSECKCASRRRPDSSGLAGRLFGGLARLVSTLSLPSTRLPCSSSSDCSCRWG